MSDKNAVEKLSEIDSHVAKHYNIIRRLGKGAYGIVWKAVDKRSKETVAMKKIFDAFRNQTDAQRTFREIMFLLSFANHENIIQLIGLHKANNDRDIYLVFEFMETDLHNVIKRGNILKDIHKVFIMYQLFKATKYIHSGNVIHRDLKPSNILLNAQCHCKIADFGLARSVTQIGEGDGESGSDPTLTDYVATRWYRAPEILIASKRYTKGIDMWSLGCILGEMLLGEPLFPGSSTINQVERIMSTLPPPTPEDIISVSAGYGTNLLEKTPNLPRRSLRDLLTDVSENALDLINRLIVFNPNHRLTAVEALEHAYVANFHHRATEPERGANVIPPLRDDVQLSVEEYRNKLYAMMDDKHRKHKNMIKRKFSGRSKSRIHRLSEHTRKETNSIGQGDSVTKKNAYFPHDDVGKDKEKSELFRKPQYGSNGRNPIAQYAHNLIHGNLRNLPPGHAKSCQYFNHPDHHHHHHQHDKHDKHHQHQSQQHQQPLTKSQRSIQSDQTAGCGMINKPNNAVSYPKLRRSIKPQIFNRLSTTTIISNPTRYSQAKRLSQKNPIGPPSYPIKMPNNITKHFASTGTHISHRSSQNEVIQNYLNQTMPMVLRLGTTINGCNVACQVNRSDINETIDGCKVTRSQTLKNHIKHSNIQKPTMKTVHSINSYNQNHGEITATAYENLRNGTIKW